MSPPLNLTTSSDTTTIDTASTTTANTSAQTLVPATPGIRTSALEQTRNTTVSLDASAATDFLGSEDTLRSSGESSGNTTICWNCKEDGHMFMDCPSQRRRLFCYKCGHDNTVTPKCPTCQGNRNANELRVGLEARSKNTMTQHQTMNQ
ncbi:uncharacterized protein LOC135950717 [Calliphora vicina]|uniref:uncharacterized protein LOC135950717 n=1 Tax=Calliphora vicina TaxID=7373 RepID=UPI00325BB96C